jgi:uncharacterized damage-inducible protein DinB
VLQSAPMSLVATINAMHEHDRWARARQLETCAGLSVDQLTRPLGGSFGTLHDTLVHLLAVEWLWLERWRGRNPAGLLPASELPTLAAVEERWRAVDAQTHAFLASLDEEALTATRTYLSTRGERWTYPLWCTMLHLFNHQGYHRGQATALLRMLGVEPPRVDFLVGLDAGFALEPQRR